jgi:hypothetical protein
MTARSWGSVPTLEPGSPRMTWSCPTTTVTPTPERNPDITGRGRRSARKPNRATPATKTAAPSNRARSTTRGPYAGFEVATSEPTPTAIIGQIVESGPMESCRDVEKTTAPMAPARNA